MAVEKYIVRRGVFLHQKAKGSGSDIGEALLESLEAASPQGRVDKWKEHAERLGVGLDYLREAESLIDDHGEVENFDRFERCMAAAQADIEAAQVEITLVPLAAARAKQLHAPKEKKNKALLKYCSELMQVNPSPSAESLFRRIPKKEKAATVDGFTIYRGEIDGDGEEKIYCITPTGKIDRTVGTRAFFDYYDATIRKLER
jgi:hypothetical protein